LRFWIRGYDPQAGTPGGGKEFYPLAGTRMRTPIPWVPGSYINEGESV